MQFPGHIFSNTITRDLKAFQHFGNAMFAAGRMIDPVSRDEESLKGKTREYEDRAHKLVSFLSNEHYEELKNKLGDAIANVGHKTLSDADYKDVLEKLHGRASDHLRQLLDKHGFQCVSRCSFYSDARAKGKVDALCNLVDGVKKGELKLFNKQYPDVSEDTLMAAVDAISQKKSVYSAITRQYPENLWNPMLQAMPQQFGLSQFTVQAERDKATVFGTSFVSELVGLVLDDKKNEWLFTVNGSEFALSKQSVNGEIHLVFHPHYSTPPASETHDEHSTSLTTPDIIILGSVDRLKSGILDTLYNPTGTQLAFISEDGDNLRTIHPDNPNASNDNGGAVSQPVVEIQIPIVSQQHKDTNKDKNGTTIDLSSFSATDFEKKCNDLIKNFSGNSITFSGAPQHISHGKEDPNAPFARAIIKVVESCRQITQFTFDKFGFFEQGLPDKKTISSLFTALGKSTTLEEITISGPINGGPKKLGEVLTQNSQSNLKTLTLNSVFSIVKLTNLIKALSDTNVTGLSLPRFVIRPATNPALVSNLVAAIEKNKVLQKLNIQWDNQWSEAREACEKHLERNRLKQEEENDKANS